DRTGDGSRATVRVECAEASPGRDRIDAQHLQAGPLPRARAHTAADASEHAVRGRWLVEGGVRDDAAGLAAPATRADVLEVAARIGRASCRERAESCAGAGAG